MGNIWIYRLYRDLVFFRRAYALQEKVSPVSAKSFFPLGIYCKFLRSDYQSFSRMLTLLNSVIHTKQSFSWKSLPLCLVVVNRIVGLELKGTRGRLGVPFLLFVCWSNRIAAVLLCYHSTALCTSKCNISASAICYLWRFINLLYR